MLIRQLEYLTALAREQHFARAAVACHVSQPALSSGIRKLEAELDVPIVRRGHRFEGFTPEGERVLRWAYRILAERDGLGADIGAMRDGHTGMLRIGVLPAAAAAFAHIATPFAMRHPRVRLSVQSMPEPEIRRGLAESGLDCGVLRAPDRGGGYSAALFRERHVLLTAGYGPFADRSQVRWAELAHVPLCGFTADPEGRRRLGDALSASGGPPAAQVETDSLPALLTHVQEGGWCAVLSHAWLCSVDLPAGLRALPLVDPVSEAEVGIAVPERHPEPLPARELLAFAREVPLQHRLDRVLPDRGTGGRVPRQRTPGVRRPSGAEQAAQP